MTYEFLRRVWSFRRRHRTIVLHKLDRFDGQTHIVERRRDIARLVETIAPGPTRTVAT
jgi:hypothetical protein